jgi:hypothetical protein
MKKDASVPFIGEFILEFLLRNPDAENTVEGIVQWWVMRQRIEYETKRVEAALRDLVNKGFLLNRQSVGSEMRYRLNKLSLREIEIYLRRHRKKEA